MPRAHHLHAKMAQEEIVFAGSTSKIGRALCILLARRGHTVRMITGCEDRFQKIKGEARLFKPLFMPFGSVFSCFSAAFWRLFIILPSSSDVLWLSFRASGGGEGQEPGAGLAPVALRSWACLRSRPTRKAWAVVCGSSASGWSLRRSRCGVSVPRAIISDGFLDV